MLGMRGSSIEDIIREAKRSWEAAPNDADAAKNYLTLSDRSQRLAEDLRNHLLKVIYAERILENHPDILEQFQGNEERLKKYGLVTVPEDPDQRPYINGIDQKKYPMPTFESIMRALTDKDKEIIQTIDEPKLLLVPFGMSLEQYVDGVTNQRGQLERQAQAYRSWELKSDETGELKYFVDQFHDPSGGFTKSDILQQDGHNNPFPGWQVLVVDGKAEIDWQTIIKGQDEEGQNIYKSAHDFLKEYKEKGYDGLTPEDIITLHLIAMESGRPFDQENLCWLLNCFLKSARAVPVSNWGARFARVRLVRYLPEHGWDFRGSRPARRVGLGR